MTSPVRAACLAGVTLLALLAGCTTPGAPVTPSPDAVRILDETGAPIPFAPVSFFRSPTVDGVGPHIATAPIALLNADAQGRLPVTAFPPEANYLVARGPTGTGGASGIPITSADLTLSTEHAPHGVLAFKPHVDLVCTEPDNVPPPPVPPLPPPLPGVPTYDCGAFGEPVVEVAGDGAIWASATCCVYKAPPIWVSRDGGLTFPQMRNADTGLVRDGYGIEGDFAIDDAGNVYFFDIAVASTWFTSYEADGTHRWTIPWPGQPLVDRPWVRAGAADEVWIIYNTGSATNVYGSTDGGKTWDLQPVTLPCPLGNAGQGPTRHDLVVAAACGDDLTVWTSHDGGKTFDAGDEVPMPDVPYRKADGRGLEVMNPPVVDEAGNLYLPFTHFVDDKNTQNAVFMARRDANGTWAEPVQVGPAGLNRLPWPAAGRAGHVGLAWYHADGTFPDEAEATWRLYGAASVDAASREPHYQWVVADPDILLHGAYGRELGDFIEADLTPGGALVAVYAGRDEAGRLTNRFVQTEGLGLASERFMNGPHPA